MSNPLNLLTGIDADAMIRRMAYDALTLEKARDLLADEDWALKQAEELLLATADVEMDDEGRAAAARAFSYAFVTRLRREHPADRNPEFERGDYEDAD